MTVDFTLDTLAQPCIGFIRVALVHTVVCGDVDLQELTVLDLIIEQSREDRIGRGFVDVKQHAVPGR